MRTTENLLASFGLTHLLNVHFHFLLKKKKEKSRYSKSDYYIFGSE